MSEAAQNLCVAYQILDRNVIRARVRTQRGDSARLSNQVSEALRLLQAAEQHRSAFPPSEYATLQQNIALMVQQLDEARHLSSDPPDAANLVDSRRVATGGRPRVEIDPAFLAQALQLRGTAHLSAVFNCSPRTIRRLAIKHGLAQPGQPVYNDSAQPDGTVARSYTSTSRAISTLTDSELDALLTSILDVFPDFGLRMLSGRLKSAGHHVIRKNLFLESGPIRPN
ncbi:hypothetical protein B0H10DRAFT_195296 [Mycena sp. CBHHK59/15]|nr:hypothetical protein B0H10DRAFT_195296 [Mycena sp. CBHHK59/15]